MKNRLAVGASLAVALLTSCVIAGDSLKSGPQPGASCTPFEPLHVTGPTAGTKSCLV